MYHIFHFSAVTLIKDIHLDINCYYLYDWKYVIIGSGSGLVLRRWQGINRIKDDPVQ